MKFRAIPRDTTLEAARMQFAIFRKMRPADRARLAIELSEMIRATLEESIRHGHPEYTDQEIKLAASRIIVGEASIRKAYSGVEVKPLVSQSDFLARIKIELDSAGISFMVVGSLGSIAYGEPRTTYDIDLVIDPTLAQLQTFVDSLGKADYYVSENAAEEAFKHRSMFNVIDLRTAWKVDLIIRQDRPYSIEEFRRRRKQQIGGIELDVVSPEDAILSKLEWAKVGESERQYRDALGVASVQWRYLNWEYMEKWASDLGVDNLLEQLREDASSLQPI